MSEITARPSGFFTDIRSVARRAIRGMLREPEAIVPALLIPVFFFFVNIGSLEIVAEGFIGVTDFRAFQLPVAIVFAVTGVSRANALVTDIQGGYFDRLLVTPIKRPALLLGLMVADFILVVSLSFFVVVLGFVMGVRFETGVPGVLFFLLLSGAWGLGFTGLPYTVALRTGNPAAVANAFLLFFPFAFLTTAFVPREVLSGWLDTAATFNPVTYLLEGLRAVVSEGWEWRAIGKAVAAIGGLWVVSFSMAAGALKARVARG
jgi:ABC-2 type transport system permease protein